eukprot:CAMPEP_0172900716 /NCGR_PEP_ID=MMETSP1075-20121228/164703_1 /TAXON_ID=2916 /ORGANISM="Ceratium fusus, Strain PA161109" /LENGTH=110 /DNA_ID=CAMNT_0013756961 /DNA_START=92 /DNA_END=425 /DNA_ORIENTATION=+
MGSLGALCLTLDSSKLTNLFINAVLLGSAGRHSLDIQALSEQIPEGAHDDDGIGVTLPLQRVTKKLTDSSLLHVCRACIGGSDQQAIKAKRYAQRALLLFKALDLCAEIG